MSGAIKGFLVLFHLEDVVYFGGRKVLKPGIGFAGREGFDDKSFPWNGMRRRLFLLGIQSKLFLVFADHVFIGKAGRGGLR